MAAGCHCRNWTYCVCFGLTTFYYHIGRVVWWLARQVGSAEMRDRCPERECRVRLFSCDIVKFC